MQITFLKLVFISPAGAVLCSKGADTKQQPLEREQSFITPDFDSSFQEPKSKAETTHLKLLQLRMHNLA